MTHMKRMKEIEKRADILKLRFPSDMSRNFLLVKAEIGMRLGNDPEDDSHWLVSLDKTLSNLKPLD